jgi:adenylylsulfate kinase
MTLRVLIMGLPGSGKTTLAQALKQQLESRGRTVSWLNADSVRRYYNDWDFSTEGRIRQSLRMRELADLTHSHYAICDFVAPLEQMRDNFAADYTVWVDTIAAGRFEDTNRAFVPPAYYDFKVTEQDAARFGELVADAILAKYLHVDPTLSS